MKRFVRSFLCFAVFVATLAATAAALALAPPTSDQLNQYIADGSMPARVADAKALGNDQVDPGLIAAFRSRALASQGYDTLPAPPPAWQNGLSSTGTQKILAVCIDFPDYPSTIASSAIQSRLDGAANPSDSSFPLESLRAYYQRSSYGKLDLRTDTYGWYRSAVPRAQIAMTSASRENLIAAALRSYDAQGVDFSQYDSNHDGKIDYLMVYWTGPSGAWSSFWWGYYTWWGSTSLVLDGVRPASYSWQWPSAASQSTSIHETGHALGLPDLYDYDAKVGPNNGVGDFDMMDSAGHDHNAFSKWMLGWSTPVFVNSALRDTQLRTAAESGDSLVVMPAATAAKMFSECFVVENRQRSGNDSRMATNPGLTVWHVDARLSGGDFAWDNSFTAHKYIAVEQADGLGGIESGSAFHAGDTWTVGKAFGPMSTPTSSRYDGTKTGVTVDSIAFSGTTATLRAYIEGVADITPPVTRPSVGGGWYRTGQTVALSATDESSSVAATWCKVGAAAWLQGSSVVIPAPGDGSNDGRHTLWFYSSDSVGNDESPQSIVVGIDTVAPVTTVGSLSYTETTATVRLVSADTGSGTASTEWRVDGGSWVSGTTARFNAEVSHLLEYRSADGAGNGESIKGSTIGSVPKTWIAVPSGQISVAYGSAVVEGVLRYGDTPIAGALVVLDESADGASWSSGTQGTLSDGAGTARFSVSPLQRRWYRLRYLPGAVPGLPTLGNAASAVVELMPTARLGVPSVPKSAKRGRQFKVSGTMLPPHSSGPKLTLVFERYERGRWVPRKTVSTTAKTSGAYSFKTKLSSSGKWRVRASHSDGSHSDSKSAYRAIRIR
jgi:M6 family metalloprotease-like protein